MTSLLLGLIVAVQYILIAANYRAVAFTRYGWIAATDLMISGMGFFAIKAVADASTWGDATGYAVGGALGGVAGTWLTRHWRAA
jgi:hypothetical protein